jgi:hypothetical protein
MSSPSQTIRDLPTGILVTAIGAVAAAVFILLFHSQIMGFVVASGTNALPYTGPNLRTDYLLGVGWALVLFVFLALCPVSKQERQALIILWIARVFVTLVIFLAFESRYGLDMDGYFRHAINPHFQTGWMRLGEGTQNVRILTWLHLKLIPGSYHASKVGFSMIGLMAIFISYKAAVRSFGRSSIGLLYVLGLFPSILFWSCHLGKEPIMLLAVGFYLYAGVGFCTVRKRRDWILLACACIITALIRMWYVPIFLLPLFMAIIVANRKKVSQWVFSLLIGFGLLVSVKVISMSLNIADLGSLFEYRNYTTGAFAGGGSTFAAQRITGLSSALRLLPEGIFTALFRPLPLELRNIFGHLQGIDNLVLLLLMIVGVIRTKLRELADPIAIWTLLFIFLWASVYGLVTHNYGSLVRYKLQILPVFLTVLLYFARPRRNKAPANSNQPCAA